MASSHSENDIGGKLCLITGASKGIGAACAARMLHLNCDLALTYATNKDAMDDIVSQIRKAYETEYPNGNVPRITVHKLDVSDADQITSTVADVKKQHGRPIDILFSNAGYGKRIVDIWDIPLEEFDTMYTINLRASFILVKAVIEEMKAQKWGRVIFNSSIAAYGGGLNGCHYAASKGGVTAMMKNLATKLAEHGVTVNDIAPAMIGGTGMIPHGQVVPGGVPVGRLGYTEEVANVLEMICKTGYMTGQSIMLAGGLNHK